jgi:hypothetical protein
LDATFTGTTETKSGRTILVMLRNLSSKAILDFFKTQGIAGNFKQFASYRHCDGALAGEGSSEP